MSASQTEQNTDLDPTDWAAFRAQGHRMLDDILDYVEHIREQPVWQPMPQDVRARFRGELPDAPSELSAVYREFLRDVLPYSNGNVHPGFLGWVHGGGNPVGILAEMLAAGLNANLGGRDHAPIEVERQIVHWMRELFGFPTTASGLFVTGTSMANLISVLVARDAALGFETRRTGLSAGKKLLTGYTSVAAHGSLRKAFDCAGLGSDALRLVQVNARQQMNLAALKRMIESDRRGGFTPFFVAGTAGTVDVGAIDDLDGLAAIAQDERLWMHVDGACGALGILAPEIAPRLAGIEAADSLAFDFHKWGQVPYDAGFVLVRDGELHRKTFASPAAYLDRETRGLAAGSSWPCDFGPDLSRGFRALKTWFTLKVHGLHALGESIARTCELARYLEKRVTECAELELLAPVQLNIVCFRFRCPDADRTNARIIVELQESGIAAPSTTRINGEVAIRAAITNHRTRRTDIDALLDATLALGREIAPAEQELEETVFHE
ncbi:MAG TPA: pyridoxal-dependent decarboxylase [Bryobacteraceae bacterium]|nr:pyridoxal-dependent decarboxylase [Bryobacteraceae bacterium]